MIILLRLYFIYFKKAYIGGVFTTMIRRTDDFSALSNNDLSKIANVVKKTENKKMYDSFEKESDAQLASSELKIQGYKTSIKKVANRYELYAERPDSVPFDEAEKSGQFKKLAWGRYCFQRESAIGLFEYPFNDGSIWKLSQDENGQPVLIKQVDEENEEDVVRFDEKNTKETTTKVAGKKRKFDFVNANSLDSVSKILYNSKINHELKKDIVVSNSRNLLNNMNEKFNKMIDEKLKEIGISSDDEEEVKSLILTALNQEIVSRDSLNLFLRKFKQHNIEKAGKKRKRFE